MKVLGIESSCDETSIAILENGKILSNEIYTQKTHSLYGGVVPELASREHIKKIDHLCKYVLNINNYSPENIDLIAVTDSPGLAGALLVGICFSIGLHTGYNIPITGVNHLEGHILSVMLENDTPKFPFLSLVVSGGHTAIYRVDNYCAYECLGQTIDDAAGEAFDKIGKMVGFDYPAGKEIEQNAQLFRSDESIPFPVARLSTGSIDFSFSGLKTSVKYYLQKCDLAEIESSKSRICYSFQTAIINSLTKNIQTAIEKTGIPNVALVGGVACNKTLRKKLTSLLGDNVYFPSFPLCTDNAAMIAKAGYENYLRGFQRFPAMKPSGFL
ncbi:MAG: tRNA (adenosine(37)-N6)-threonylcarbamoyltransferase complex transferase subunit TsaD [Chitinispirillia bacterium]|jgi:N6-L-threonylcarbamoyladenine synthase